MATMTTPGTVEVPIEQLDVSAYTIPTDFPESDGTLEWGSTTIVVVELSGGGKHGLGYTYTSAAAATVIKDLLAPAIEGVEATDIPAAWEAMAVSVRNVGRAGIASAAISAVDAALWDLKGQLLELPVAKLLGRARRSVPIYGSGGFTSYSIERLQEQLGAWRAEGIRAVKIKVGRKPGSDLERVRASREAIGEDLGLYVDANGAYTRKQALAFAAAFAEHGVSWFEEPVSSDDLEGLRLLRDRGPAGMDIAAGEYGYDLPYYRRMLEACAVDCLQADATRCGGITGFLAVGALCEAHALELSAHTAPALHTPAGCALRSLRHLEYFHDHVRIERLLFDGAPEPIKGRLEPDLARPGLGLELKRADAARYAV